jgi:hypothetical protein
MKPCTERSHDRKFGQLVVLDALVDGPPTVPACRPRAVSRSSHGRRHLYKGGFGGQGLYVSPARDLVIKLAGTPSVSGAVNHHRWHSRRLAVGPQGLYVEIRYALAALGCALGRALTVTIMVSKKKRKVMTYKLRLQ